MQNDQAEWEIIDSILDEIADSSAVEMGAIIKCAKMRYPDISARIDRLGRLAQSEAPFGTHLDDAAPELVSAFMRTSVDEYIGREVGAYRIVSFHRRGGMGIVYRGERADGAFEQTVAIKLIPEFGAGAGIRDMFERERRHLARLEHPNIARIIDAGVLADATLYYVMEYIDGVEFDRYIHTLSSLDERITQCSELCGAVAYCHRSMVVHGDIKPSNVLVADGRVRLLDFGISQLQQEAGAERPSEPVQAYSPTYAAPELKTGEEPSVRSDVYALGILIGKALFGDKETIPTAAMKKGRKSQDLRAIVQKCTAPEPDQRYESAEAVEKDLRAFLGGYIVNARNPSRIYRMTRFTARNAVLVCSISLIFLALIAGLGTTYWQFQSAQAEARRADEINQFLTSLLENADPVVAGEEEVTLRDVIDDAATRIHTELFDAPDIRADAQFLLGNAYFGIGEYDDAIDFHRQALEYWRNTDGDRRSEIVKGLNAVGRDLSLRGDNIDAAALHYEALNILEEAGKLQSVEAARTWTGIGISLKDDIDPDGALQAFLRAHKIYQKILPENDKTIVRSLGNLARGYRSTRNIAKSAETLEQALEIAARNGEVMAPQILSFQCNLALDYGGLGRTEEARATQEQCISRTARRMGDDHPSLAGLYNNLGVLDLRLGKLDDAEEVYLKALEIAQEKLPENSRDRLATEINYAVTLWQAGRADQAIEILRDVLKRFESQFGEDNAATKRVRSILGRVLLQKGSDTKTAHDMIESSIPGLTRLWRADALLWLAEAKLEIGDTEGAAALAAASLEEKLQLTNQVQWQIAEAEYIQAVALNDRQGISQSLEVFENELPPNHFRRMGRN